LKNSKEAKLLNSYGVPYTYKILKDVNFAEANPLPFYGVIFTNASSQVFIVMLKD